MVIRKTVRLDETLLADIANIAKQNNQSENLAIETALKYYRDFYFTKNKATFLNEEITEVLKAVIQLSFQNQNVKVNQILSELAIQSNIQNQILAEELDVNPAELEQMRLRALEFLRANNRVLRLNEIT